MNYQFPITKEVIKSRPLAQPASITGTVKFYKVKAKNNRTISIEGRSLFNSYEEARQAVRKVLRRKVQGAIQRMYAPNAKAKYGWWDDVSRNPARLGGYKIVRA